MEKLWKSIIWIDNRSTIFSGCWRTASLLTSFVMSALSTESMMRPARREIRDQNTNYKFQNVIIFNYNKSTTLEEVWLIKDQRSNKDLYDNVAAIDRRLPNYQSSTNRDQRSKLLTLDALVLLVEGIPVRGRLGHLGRTSTGIWIRDQRSDIGGQIVQCLLKDPSFFKPYLRNKEKRN